ncbi:MAG: hypothetical protein F4Y86_07185 [Gammaproteobacteria bacterium]|nr:hypothetical protein [Gammaproteobacteria bacterium]MXY52294.1 hypothetical protein [Gammaproteobacteria bacterium]MYB39024.1 hypothetical protein [Gammaproteobacteria bacterium]
MSKTNLKPIAAAIGAAIVASLSGAAALDQDPFEARDVEPAYKLFADAHGGEGKCGEGKCGEDGDKEGDDDAEGEGDGDEGGDSTEE